MRDTNNQTVPAAPRFAEDIERRVMEVLVEHADADPVRIDRETRFHELGDSLDRVEAVMKLEEEFEIQLPDEDVEKLRTVGELIDYLRGRLT